MKLLIEVRMQDTPPAPGMDGMELVHIARIGTLAFRPEELSSSGAQVAAISRQTEEMMDAVIAEARAKIAVMADHAVNVDEQEGAA